MTREEAKEIIDLTKILKDCPKRWKFWSPLFGEVEFVKHYENRGFFNVHSVGDGTDWSFTYNATIILCCVESKEIMIYPSREQRDWSKFTAPWYKKERFDPKTLQPFDRVLVRNGKTVKWKCEHFSYFESYDDPCMASISYAYCIPYNDDTKHLVGTEDEAPEYYRYWED